MNFDADLAQTQTPKLMDFRFLAIHALDESSGLGTPVTRILRYKDKDGAHWSAPNHIFGETAVVGVSEAESDYDYNYKNEFQIWKETRNLSGIIFP